MTKKITEHFGDLSLIDLMYSIPSEDCCVLELVTAGYIDGEPETQKDLLDKMEGYLGHIQSDVFKKDYPQSTVYIDVTFTETPDARITDLLYHCIPWCKDNGAIMRLKIGDDYMRFTGEVR